MAKKTDGDTWPIYDAAARAAILAAYERHAGASDDEIIKRIERAAQFYRVWPTASQDVSPSDRAILWKGLAANLRKIQKAAQSPSWQARRRKERTTNLARVLEVFDRLDRDQTLRQEFEDEATSLAEREGKLPEFDKPDVWIQKHGTAVAPHDGPLSILLWPVDRQIDRAVWRLRRVEKVIARAGGTPTVTPRWIAWLAKVAELTMWLAKVADLAHLRADEMNAVWRSVVAGKAAKTSKGSAPKKAPRAAPLSGRLTDEALHSFVWAVVALYEETAAHVTLPVCQPKLDRHIYAGELLDLLRAALAPLGVYPTNARLDTLWRRAKTDEITRLARGLG